MRWIFVIGTLLPLGLWGDPVACPTTTYADYLTIGSCTIADYTLSNFTFTSTALNGQSTAYTADEFDAAPDDHLYPANGYFYFGVNFDGAPSAPAGTLVQTNINFDIANTDATDSIAGVALSLNASAGVDGSVTLDDYGNGEGQPFFLQADNANPLAQQLFNPYINEVDTNAVLISNGPDTIQDFQIKITDLSGVPEPASWSLLGIGLLMMFAGLYRRKRQA